MFVKDFQHLSPPALNNSIATQEGSLPFPIFIQFIVHFNLLQLIAHFNLHLLHTSTLILLTAPSTLLASMLSFHSFSTFINFSMCSFQIFFPSSTLTLTVPLSSLRQVTSTTSFFSPNYCLAIPNNSQSLKQPFPPPLELSDP